MIRADGPPTTPILQVEISRLDFNETMRAVEERVALRKGGYCCFVNVHSSTESTRNPELQEALNGAFLACPDGIPLVWVSKLKSQAIGSRVCGPDFTAALLRKHPDWAFGFIGGRPGQPDKIATNFGLKRILSYSPPFRPFTVENAQEDWRNFLKLCPEGAPPAVVWVGLGAPKQELWMKTVSQIAPDVLFFGVGAAFDFLAGDLERAPRWMQRSGLEWLFRLSQEPGRLWKRYFLTNSRFVAKAGKEIVMERLQK